MNSKHSSMGMKAQDLIPVKKEFSFLFKITAVMIASAATASAILYFFLDTEVGDSYGNAFRLMAQTLQKMNAYIVGAVLVQLLLSCVVIYFVALYFSHKIAGPIFRLKAVLQKYIAGDVIEEVNFRTTDFIPGVSVLFSDFFAYMGNRKHLILEAESLIDELDSSEKCEAHSKRLLEIINLLENDPKDDGTLQ